MKSFSFKSALLIPVLVSMAFAFPDQHTRPDGGCNLLPKYTFNNNVLIKASTTISGLDDPMEFDMRMATSADSRYMGMIMEGGMIPGGVKTIIDMKDSVFYMLMDMGGMKNAQCMDMNSKEFKKQMDKSKDEVPDYSKFTKTGNTKKIKGYTCEEYQFKNDEMTMNLWMTNEVENIFKGFTGFSGGPGGIQLPEGMDGMWLSMTMEGKQSGMDMKVVADVQEINKGQITEIETVGYSLK